MRLFVSVGSWAATDAAFLLTASVLALDLGGPGAVGLVGALRVLPAALCAGLVTGVTDRVSRPLIIAAVNAALVVVAVAAAVAAGHGAGLGTLLALVGAASAVSALLKPSQQALLPQLVSSPGHLLAAGSTWSTLNAVGSVLGPALAGLVLALWGPVAVFIGLALVYLGTALVAWSIRSPFQPARRTGGRFGWARVASPFLGIALFWRPGPRSVFALLMVGRVMSGLLTVFVVLSARSLSSGGGEALTGTLFAALGVGGMVASVATLAAGGRHARLWLCAGVAAYGMPVAALGVVGGVTLVWTCLAVAGLGNALLWIYGANLVSRLLPDHLSGRGWGAVHGLGAGAAALGSLGAPVLVGALGLPGAMLTAGLVVALSPVLGWSGLRAAEVATTPPQEVVEILGRVPVLAPLPGLSLARLAAATQHREVASGVTVVREGTPGDEFYVVEEGELVVSRQGAEIRRLGRGDAFGEVALLRTVTRTATVVAATSARLLCIGTEQFVSSVTGHRAADTGAEAEVTALLAADADRSRRTTPDPPA